MKILMFFVLLLLTGYTSAQTTLYVNPDAADNPSADGSLSNPYNDIAAAVDIAAATGGEVIIIDGDYDMTGKSVSISTAATAATAVTIKPQTTAGVKLNFNERFGFEFEPDSRYITLEGLELNGRTDELDYWSIVARAFWGDETVPRNGGLAVILDGQYITLRDNYIHHWYQKGVEIRDCRYVIIQGNIIEDIAVTSLSGGHGIMRQQKGQEFFTDDVAGVYRWDISENLIFNVKQTIYSWVPSKGFIEMVIDEGKSILIDDPKDTDGVQEHMTARIKNNIVAFGVVDHIRLKSTPNLEVSHNSIYSEGEFADGISDKQGDTNTPQFTNFICHNNASQTVSAVSAIEIDKAVEQTIAAGGTPDVTGNYAMDGKIKPPGQSGLTKLTGGQLFVNPNAGDFTVNPALGLPASVGVMPAVLTALNQKAAAFNVTVGASSFEMSHLRLTQTILDNIPGLNDGINGNENVFADYGTMSADYHTITFNVVNGDWKSDNNSPNTQDFELNENYYTWYQSIDNAYLNNAGNNYERIRWGTSEVMQNQVFDPDWLTVCQITGTSENTLLNGYDNDFTLDGDILIDFENFTPQIGDAFDLMTANQITGSGGAGFSNTLFDRVLFEGFTPDNYSLEVMGPVGNQKLTLTVLSALPAELLSFEAMKENQQALLTWTTAFEQNNAFFAIERSLTGAEWAEIGRLTGQGNTTRETIYTYVDKNPASGKNYYRLRQQDTDGSFRYSQIRNVSFGDDVGSISPNPVSDRFTLQTNATARDLRLFDQTGKEVTGQCIIGQTNEGYYVSAELLPAGVYFVHFISADGQSFSSVKFLKVNHLQR